MMSDPLRQLARTSKAPLRFYVFDLLHINDDSLTQRILEKRRKRLENEFVALPQAVRLSPILFGEPKASILMITNE
jgi:ATP-dependent DNA ligase